MPDGKNSGNGGKIKNSNNQNGNATQNNENSTTIPPYPSPSIYPGFPFFGYPDDMTSRAYRPPFPVPPYNATPHPAKNDDELKGLIREMNSRLVSIESSVARIGSIEQELSHLRVQMTNIQSTNSHLSQKVNEIDSACQFISTQYDNIIRSKEESDAEVRHLKSQNTTLDTQIQTLMTQNSELNSRCLDLQLRTMEHNLIVFGVQEEARTDDRGTVIPENTKIVLTEKLSEKLIENEEIGETGVTSENLTFGRVYRVGNPSKAKETGRPRPIIARFEKLCDRDKVRQAGIQLNAMSKSMKIYEHFPREIEERRKKLYPIVRRLADKGEKVSLVKDKLFINNKLYDINTGVYIDKYGRQCNIYPNPPRYDAYDHRDADNRLYDRRDNRQYNRYPYTLNRPTQSSEPIPQNTHRPSTLMFETPNRFNALARDDPDRPTQKRSYSSPLESDVSKRQNMDFNDNNSDNFQSNSLSTACAHEHDVTTKQTSDPYAGPQSVDNDLHS